MFAGIVTDIGGIESVSPLGKERRQAAVLQQISDPATIDMVGLDHPIPAMCLTVTGLPEASLQWPLVLKVEAWEEASIS